MGLCTCTMQPTGLTLWNLFWMTTPLLILSVVPSVMIATISLSETEMVLSTIIVDFAMGVPLDLTKTNHNVNYVLRASPDVAFARTQPSAKDALEGTMSTQQH